MDQTPMASQCILGYMMKSGSAKTAKTDKWVQDRIMGMDILISPILIADKTGTLCSILRGHM